MSKLTEKMIAFKELNEVRAALNTISNLPLSELGDHKNLQGITLAKKNLLAAFDKHKEIYDKDSKALMGEYSDLSKKKLDKDGERTGGYEWKEGVDRDEYKERADALALVQVKVAMPKVKLKLLGNPRVTLLTLEKLKIGFWEDIVDDSVDLTK